MRHILFSLQEFFDTFTDSSHVHKVCVLRFRKEVWGSSLCDFIKKLSKVHMANCIMFHKLYIVFIIFMVYCSFKFYCVVLLY